MSTINIVQLENSKILAIQETMPPHMLQGRRLLAHLADNPKTPSGTASQTCSIGNLSDVAHQVNPYLREHNLMIGCEKPLLPIYNKFNEPSNQFLWSLYQVPQAANDDRLTETSRS